MTTVVVVVAHGSRVPEATDAHRAVCADLRGRVDADIAVEPAYLELNDPDIATAVEQAVTGGAERIIVVPYFLHPGNHTLRDIPAAVAAARSSHPQTIIDQAPMFGADPGLVSTLAEQVQSAVATR